MPNPATYDDPPKRTTCHELAAEARAAGATPKLTAEKRARSCVVTDEVVSHPMNIDDVIHQIDEATCQAFEEVAKMLDRKAGKASALSPAVRIAASILKGVADDLRAGNLAQTTCPSSKA